MLLTQVIAHSAPSPGFQAPPAIGAIAPGALAPATAEPSVRFRVKEMLASLGQSGQGLERRRQQRFPYPRLIKLTPLAAGLPLESEAIVVAGKFLSEKGLGFFHPAPLPHRRLLASLDHCRSGKLDFVIDVSWCRFTRHGWYESGGRFIELIVAPRA